MRERGGNALFALQWQILHQMSETQAGFRSDFSHPESSIGPDPCWIHHSTLQFEHNSSLDSASSREPSMTNPCGFSSPPSNPCSLLPPRAFALLCILGDFTLGSPVSFSAPCSSLPFPDTGCLAGISEFQWSLSSFVVNNSLTSVPCSYYHSDQTIPEKLQAQVSESPLSASSSHSFIHWLIHSFFSYSFNHQKEQ